MPTYQVESPLLHSGKKYMPGSTVELDDSQAEPLLQVGAVSIDTNKIPPRPNANDTIALVKAAATIEELEELAVGEERKSVLPAIATRRAELTPGADK